MWWELAVVLSIAYSAVLTGIAIVVVTTRPKCPHRVSFTEIQERAVRTRDVILPAAAAVVLGFFVSLAAGFVHDDFRSPLAERLHWEAAQYLYLLVMGGLLSFALFGMLLIKIGSAARDVAHHPSSINRAAELLNRGKEVDDLDALDLERNLVEWKVRRGHSAARVMIGLSPSTRINRLLLNHEWALRTERLPRWFSVKLFAAKTADYWWSGATLLVALCGTGLFVIVTGLIIVSDQGPSGGVRGVVALLCVCGEVAATLVFLRMDALHVARTYRIDRIELAAAERRISRLLQKPTAVPEPRGALRWWFCEALRRARGRPPSPGPVRRGHVRISG